MCFIITTEQVLLQDSSENAFFCSQKSHRKREHQIENILFSHLTLVLGISQTKEASSSVNLLADVNCLFFGTLSIHVPSSSCILLMSRLDVIALQYLLECSVAPGIQPGTQMSDLSQPAQAFLVH